MDRTALQALQAPLKDQYREKPEAAVYTLRADGRLGDENVSCNVETGRALVEARAALRHRRGRNAGLLRRHAPPGARRLRRGDATGGGDGHRRPGPGRHRPCRRRSRLPGHARRQQGSARSGSAPCGCASTSTTDATDEQLATLARRSPSGSASSYQTLANPPALTASLGLVPSPAHRVVGEDLDEDEAGGRRGRGGGPPAGPTARRRAARRPRRPAAARRSNSASTSRTWSQSENLSSPTGPARAGQLQQPAAEEEDRPGAPLPVDVQAEHVAVEGDGPLVVDRAVQDAALEDFHAVTFSPNDGRGVRTRRLVAGPRSRG